MTGGVERHADGSWTIAADHLDHAAAYEAARAHERPVTVKMLSARPLEALIAADAATWLDRELVASQPEPLRDAGFGHAVRDAQAQRRQWLVQQGLAGEESGTIRYRAELISLLQRRELLRVAGQLSDELGLRFVEHENGRPIDGVLRRPVELMSGRFALIEKSREFALVPWKPVLDRHVGKPVGGIVRKDGISWEVGRSRRGQTIS